MKKIYKLGLILISIFCFNINAKAIEIDESISNLENRLNNYKTNVFLNSYPVGSIYITTSTDENTTEKVSSKYGGTWEVYGADRVLKGTTSTSGQTGGTSTATLSVSNIPSHAHSIPVLSGTAANTGSGYSLSLTYATRTTSKPNVSETVTKYYYSGIGATYGLVSDGYVGYIRPSSSKGTRGVTSLSVSKTHTHNISDCYANSISGVQSHKHSVTTTASNTGSTGSGQSFSILDPYITTYMYKRIS